MAILVFIRELSYRLTKVLDSHLETIMAAVYALMTNTKNKALHKESVYTLRTLAKYSSDVKMLYFVSSMPQQMFDKFKLSNAYIMSFILSKANMNILTFDDSMIRSIVKLSSSMFADSHTTISDLGEGMIVDLFKRFVDRRKADACLTIIRDTVSKRLADQLIKHLKLHFDDIDDMIKVSKHMQAIDAEAVGRPVSSSLFGKNAMTLIDGSSPIDKYKADKPMTAIAPIIHRKRTMVDKDGDMSTRRDHGLQDKLMDEIHQLLGG